MKKINSVLQEKALKIITIFLFLQPIIDILTATSLKFFNNSFILGLFVRIAFMLYMMYYAVFLSKNNNKYLVFYLVLIIIYGAFFSVNITLQKGITALLYEFKILIKCFYFPIILVTLIPCFKDNKDEFDIAIFSKLFIIYCLGVLIPSLLGIGFNSYEVTKNGSIGFFYTANEIGAIISILMVYYILKLYNSKKYLELIISVFIIIYMLTEMGTKAPLLLTIVLCLYILVKYLINIFKQKQYKLFAGIISSFIIICSIFIVTLPKTNFYKNIVVHLEYLKVDSVDDILTNEKKIDHFVFSERLSFWKKTNRIYKNSNISDKLLGIGYISEYSNDQESMKLVEMDFVDIFYRHGVVGFIIYISSLLFISYKILIKLYRIKIKDKHIQIYIVSFIFSLLLAIVTGHVLIAPGVSIYVALTIGLLYNDVNRRYLKCQRQN